MAGVLTADGHGSGSGHGSGYGYGSCDGSGSGYGYGYGDVVIVGSIAGHSATVYHPWLQLRIGCECHSVTYWREHWGEIALEHNVDVTDEIETRLMLLLDEVSR